MVAKKTLIEIKVEKRTELAKKVKKVLERGFIPAVVYGKKQPAISISVEAKEFIKKVMRSGAGHNLIFDLKVNLHGKTKSIPVITHEIQRNPLTDDIIHLDFEHVVMDEIIKAKVPIEFLGIPIGVKDDGGVLIHGERELEIKCLPIDIPDKFQLDVSALAINDSLSVADLKVSSTVEVLTPPEEMLAQVAPPTKEEEVAGPTPEEILAAGEPGAEGAAPAEGAKPADGAKPAEGKPADGKEKAPAPAAPAKGKEKKDKK